MTVSKKVLGIIPARFGSMRFPGKPLAKILGKTLIQHTYENAAKCSLLNDIVVATDDLRIYSHVISFGGKAVMTSSDCLTGTDRLAEVLQSKAYDDFEYVINIQGDEPCIEPTVLAQVIEVLIADKKASMSSAIVEIESIDDLLNPSIVKCVFDKEHYALYFSRAPIPSGKTVEFKQRAYYRHLGIYAYHRQFLLHYTELLPTTLQLAEDLEQLKVLEHGYKIKLALVKSASIGVDNVEDIKKVELLLI